MSKRTMSASVFVFIIGVAAQSFAVTDDFESYDTGNIDGQGDWIDFGGTLLTNVSTDQALSGTKALKLTINPVDPNPFDIPGYGSDVYQDLPTEHTTGTWDLSYWVYVPGDFNGASILHLSETIISGSDDLDFGLQLVVDGSDSFNEFLASQDGETGTGVTLIRDSWVEVTASIDLDANTVSATYNGQSIFNGTWDPNPVGQSDVPSIGGFNIWVQGGDTGSIYYDDLSLVPEPGSAVMALLGLGFIASFRRRRQA